MNDKFSDTIKCPVLLNIFQEMRPRQWTKNIIVLAAFFFALGDKEQNVSLILFWAALLAAILFSVTASAIYVFNDIYDIRKDRFHPVKKKRPVAAGLISIPFAWGIIIGCLLLGLPGAWFLSANFGIVLTVYVALQIVYSLALKHIAILDVFIIAIGFVLRAVAGAFVVQVTISPWLLICTFLLALFLALCKRRHEKWLMAEKHVENFRHSLISSNIQLLDQLVAIVAGAVIVTYAIYTQWPDTIEKFGTSYLSLTIPFVIFGLFRYLDLVYRHRKGDQPEAILLADIPLLIDVALFGFSVFLITSL